MDFSIVSAETPGTKRAENDDAQVGMLFSDSNVGLKHVTAAPSQPSEFVFFALECQESRRKSSRHKHTLSYCANFHGNWTSRSGKIWFEVLQGRERERRLGQCRIIYNRPVELEPGLLRAIFGCRGILEMSTGTWQGKSWTCGCWSLSYVLRKYGKSVMNHWKEEIWRSIWTMDQDIRVLLFRKKVHLRDITKFSYIFKNPELTKKA